MLRIFYLGTAIRIFFRLLRIGWVITWEVLGFYIWRPIVKEKYNLGERLRKRFEKLGPLFVKFGQILSTRSDIIPEDITQKFEKLQSEVKPFSYTKAQKIIKKDFKKPVNKVFKKFEQKPFAAASLGQVYRAELATREKVAVKVQRPGAKKIVTIDTGALLFSVKLIEVLVPELKKYNLQEAVKEFRRWTLNELNYTLEAANADIFSQHFLENEHVYSPKVFWDFTTKRVLTLEFIEGVSLKELLKSEGHTKEKKLIAEYGSDAFIKQYFEFGFFHADPHPGNMFVTKKNILYFLDFGMVGRLDSRLTELIANIFLALLQKDEEKIVQIMTLVHNEYSVKENADLTHAQINSFRKSAGAIIDQWYGVKNKKYNFTRVFYELLNAAVQSGFYVPVDAMMMAKSIVTLDSVTKRLDPSFDLGKFEEPIIRKMIEKRLDPKRIKNQAQGVAEVLDRMINSLPVYSQQLADQLSQGSLLGKDISPYQLAMLESHLDARASRRSLAMITAAMVIASVWLLQSASQPVLLGFQLSSIGFVFSFILLLKVLLVSKGELKV